MKTTVNKSGKPVMFSVAFGESRPAVNVTLLTVLLTDLRDGTSRVKSHRRSGSTG